MAGAPHPVMWTTVSLRSPRRLMVERDCARSWLQLEDEDEDHRVRIHEHDEARLLHLWEYT